MQASELIKGHIYIIKSGLGGIFHIVYNGFENDKYQFKIVHSHSFKWDLQYTASEVEQNIISKSNYSK